MTTKERIKQILVDYTKNNRISASIAILEDYAEELVNNGVIIPTRCKECEHFEASGGVCKHFGYYTYDPDVDEDDFCSYGERKKENGS